MDVDVDEEVVGEVVAEVEVEVVVLLPRYADPWAARATTATVVERIVGRCMVVRILLWMIWLFGNVELEAGEVRADGMSE